ncbi:hypothetical protein DERF_002677 [Dermatophagoides farinae]|uniref:Uncharacterized protein n=1 Tax=Dermatophagoides farinae TaxID=6954 RepID=A0A922LC58_DERFA|nr:hypothetical protein DERF_002677 [Dermatophagoides farinae]
MKIATIVRYISSPNNISTVQHINRIDRKNRQRLANELIDKSTDNIVVVWNKVDKTESWYHRLKKYAKVTANNRPRDYDYNRMPINFIKKYERNNMMISWNDRYLRDRFGTNIKKLCPNLHDARKFVPYIDKFVTQTLTGHGQFGAYLSNPTPYQRLSMLNRLRHDYRISINNSDDPKEKTRLTAVFYGNIAMFADQQRRSVHRLHPPSTKLTFPGGSRKSLCQLTSGGPGREARPPQQQHNTGPLVVTRTNSPRVAPVNSHCCVQLSQSPNSYGQKPVPTRINKKQSPHSIGRISLQTSSTNEAYTTRINNIEQQ